MAETDGAPTLRLTVAEALPRDVGRGIARMDPAHLARLGIQVGDIVQVQGKRAVGAKAMPTYPGERGKGVVQVDGLLRENTVAGLGDQVQVQKTSFSRAISLVLALAGSAGAAREPDYLRRALEGLPITRGDRVRVNLLGGRYQEFQVTDASPDGVVVVGPQTLVKVRSSAAAGAKERGTTYEDIGALRQEVQRIREMVELPLKHPELFGRLGIEAPKGVLLHGPPGCGKTLIARAVANETDAAFFPITGPEVIHKFYGESEAHLRAVFEEATKKAPAIIFIDEIDAIAAKREDVRGDQQVERRVVAQLLALMDGLKERGKVVVIGATNLPNILDPALRRPGRFDREIAIKVPDRNGRLEILHIHTRGMPLAADVSLERLAEITHGFVGADLEALCREAAMTTLRRLLPQFRWDADFVPLELLERLEVAMDDFLAAFGEIEPSAIREVFTEVPNVRWEDVGGLEGAKETLQEAIEGPLRYPELFARAGARPPKGILLTGPPGTGKTLLAKAVATQSGANFIAVQGPALLSKWIGESERGVREVFKRARQASPCIVFFDEIDALAPSRGSSGDSHVTERVVSQLLTELDGIEDLKGVTVLAATNRPDMLDPALLRAGRFEVQVRLPLPNAQARQDILVIHTRGKPLAPDVDLLSLAAATEGLSGGDLEALSQRAAMLAIADHLRSSPGDAPRDASSLFVAARHLHQALRERRGEGP